MLGDWPDFISFLEKEHQWGRRVQGEERDEGGREGGRQGGREREDRKSTRLNSSHLMRSRMPSSA